MAIAATIPGSPLATPTQIAAPPPLGQAAQASAALFTRQAVTPNADTQFRPNQLPTPAEQPPALQRQVQFLPQGGGGAAPIAAAPRAPQEVAAPKPAPVPLNARASNALYMSSATAFLTQLFGQAGGVLQTNGLALFGAMGGFLQAPKAHMAAQLPATQPMRYSHHTGGTPGEHAVRATASSKGYVPIYVDTPPPPLAAQQNRVHIKQAHRSYRSAQLFTRPTAFQP
jgi:hypothetical protein